MYSQNNEEQIVMEYFGGRKGRLLDIGANDGITFSNSRALLLSGWTGILLDPAPSVRDKLARLYFENNQGIQYFNYGIAECTGYKTLYESGVYNQEPSQTGLLSCIDPGEKQRWANHVSFQEVPALFITFEEFMKMCVVQDIRKFEFITIDAEGYDWVILQQIDLNLVGCECLCIEHNSKAELMSAYQGYCEGRYAMREIGRNPENIIFAR